MNTNANQNGPEVEAITTSKGTFVVFAISLLNACGPQMLQLILSTILVIGSNYFQHSLINLTSNAQVFMSNVQLMYLNQAKQLYDLSVQYATGIIEINDSSFLMNMDLLSKVEFSSSEPNVTITPQNQNNPQPVTISSATIKSVLDRYKKIFRGNSPLDKLCVITVINDVISVKIPGIAKPIPVPTLGNAKQEGDWFILCQGYPGDNYLYLINRKTRETYIFRNNNQMITWFMYKSEAEEIYISMTLSNITIGDKSFMLIKTPGMPATLSTRVKQVEDVMNLSI